MYVGKTVYGRTFPRSTIVRPYDEFLTVRADVGLQASDQMASFGAELGFARPGSGIVATASEA
jgi:hypothetical protein